MSPDRNGPITKLQSQNHEDKQAFSLAKGHLKLSQRRKTNRSQRYMKGEGFHDLYYRKSQGNYCLCI